MTRQNLRDRREWRLIKKTGCDPGGLTHSGELLVATSSEAVGGRKLWKGGRSFQPRAQALG